MFVSRYTRSHTGTSTVSAERRASARRAGASGAGGLGALGRATGAAGAGGSGSAGIGNATARQVARATSARRAPRFTDEIGEAKPNSAGQCTRGERPAQRRRRISRNARAGREAGAWPGPAAAPLGELPHQQMSVVDHVASGVPTRAGSVEQGPTTPGALSS